MPQREIGPDDVIRALFGAVEELTSRTPIRVTGNSSGAGDDDQVDAGMHNPMTTAGDVIIGGTDGAPRVVHVGAHVDGEVFQLIDGIPGWGVSTGTTNQRYRANLYSTYGGGSFLFDSDGHAMYTLEELE